MNEVIEFLDLKINEVVHQQPDLKLELARIERIFELAQCIKRYRVDQGLTQSQLAKLIGKTQPFVARLENPNSVKEPSLATLDKLAFAMNLELSVTLNEKGENDV